MKNVFLGGNGLVGGALRERLMRDGEEVVSYDLSAGYDLRQFVPPPGDGDTFYWFLAWDNGGAKYLRDASAQRDVLVNNVSLCQHVFGWLAARRERFLFTGSQLAGGQDAYGLTKALAQYWARCVGGQVAVLWNVYDAERVSERSRLVPDVIAQALTTGEIRLLTAGAERLQLLHASDCADALVRQRDAGQPEAHVTSGTWITVREVAERVAELTGARVRPAERRVADRALEPTLMLPGWRPKLSLSEGLTLTIERMKDMAGA